MESPVIDRVLRSDALPTLAVVAAKVLSVSDREEVGLDEIADIITRDSSLAARILRVANSPLYSISRTVGTVAKAVLVLGINNVRSLVLSFSLLDVRGKRGSDLFDYERFWEHSLACGVTARRLLKELGGKDPEEGLLAGLLANMGVLLLARTCPEEYGRILRMCSAGKQPLQELEQEILGISHGHIGAELARHWHLPPFFQAVMAYHHAPEELPGSDEAHRRLVQVVHLAEILADLFHAPEPDRIRELFLRRARELIGFEEDLFKPLAEGVHDEVKQAADYFGINVTLDRSLAEILQEANQRLGEINLVCEQMNRELIEAKVEFLRIRGDLQQRNLELQRLADQDGLTGAYNHRYFQQFLHNEINRAQRHPHPVSLILFDVDSFKILNDTHGHQVGDHILKEICRLCRLGLREYDLLARYGGEEFALVLPETPLEVASQVAERLRGIIAENEFFFKKRTYRITISFGVACQQPERLSHSELIHRADSALLQAKREGKNRVVTG